MGLGDMVSGLFGSDNQGSFHMDPVKTDPNAYNWGGRDGGATADAYRYQQMGANAQNRQGVQLGTGQIDQSRAQQQQSLDLQRQAALGQTPSVAALQQQKGLESAMLAQQSMASSARGPAALAGAQYQAQANAGAQQQAAVNQAAQLRAQEMAQARDAYAQSAAGMRGQDFQQSATQAQLEAQQRGMNDQMQLGMTGYEFGVNNAQLQAQMQQQQQIGQNALGAQALNLKAQQGADEINQQNGIMGLAIGAAGAAALSDERAKTGISSEGGALGYGMPSGVSVDRSPSSLDGTPTLAPYLGLMSMNTQALGYGKEPGVPAAPAAPSPTAATSGPKKDDDSKLQSILGMAGAGTGSGGGNDPMKSAQAGMAIGSSLGGALGMLSDARAKKGAHAEGDWLGRPMLGGSQDPRGAAPAQMLDHLQPVSYNYRPGVGEDPHERQYGIIAQDMARTPMGASALERRPDGLIAIDHGRGLGVALGGLANVNQRLRMLESERGAKGGR